MLCNIRHGRRPTSIIEQLRFLSKLIRTNLMFIGPCIIAIVEEWKTNLMSLAILFHVLWAQHVSDINISIFRSLRLCWWITTGTSASTCKTNTTKYQPQQKLQHTTNWPTTSTQVFLGFPVSKSKCWDGSQDSKLPLHASHVALQT